MTSRPQEARSAASDPGDVQLGECHNCGHSADVCECEQPDTEGPVAATASPEYVEDGDGYRCGTCGATILGATVTHPVHLPGGLLGGSAGFGEVECETVPYCPNCETKPSSYGAPIHYDV